MKRSEMVLKIAERFRENGVRPTRICIEEAEYLLDNIEEAGMLPPERTYTLVFKNGSQIQVPHNSWEPEDE